MKANGNITNLLNTAVHNEHDYYHRVIYPILDYLKFPDDGIARWPQFRIRNPFGTGNLKLDYLSIVSLPRVFKNNNAKMSLLYMVRNKAWNPQRKVLIASVPMRTVEPDPESVEGAMREAPTNIYAELESIVDSYEEVEQEDSQLPPGGGMADILDCSPSIRFH